MSYVPLKSARGLYVMKNGQLMESGITLDFFLIPSQFSDEFSQKLTAGSYSGMKSMNYYSDSRYPSVDNPTILKSYLTTFKTFAAASSSLCKSTYLYDLLTTVGDEVIIYSMETGSGYGFGWQYAQYVSPLKVLYPVAIINGTKYVGVGQPQSIGIASGNEARAMAWGVMIDPVTKEGAIYFGRASYHTPENYYDTGSVVACEVRGMADMKILVKSLFFNMPPEPVPDPYDSNNYGPGENQGGDGDGDDTSDVIDMPSTPALTVTSSRFVTVYTPSAQQIEDLAGRLIDPTVFQSLANAVEDISSCVIGLHIVPIVVPYVVPDRQVCCNFMGISIGLGVYLNRATAQFLDVDCGSLDVEEYWGNCLDYAPYTQISLFLPFCGFYDLDVDEVMGKTIQVKYRVDIASGSCMASIIVNGSIMYQYSGNCSQQIPVSSVDFNSFLTNAFSVAVATATSGAAVAAAGSAVLGAGDSTSPQSSHQMDSAGAEKLAMAHYDTVKIRAEGRIAGAAVNAVMNSKPHYNHGGSLSGSTGFLGCKKPYLIIKRPNPMIPDMYGKFHGYPTNTYAKLDDLIGYTEVADIRLNIPDATVDEIIECERLLKDGVVL